MNTCIKYHSYLKEGYGANMDDEDWNTYWSTSVLVKNNIIFSWQSENRDEHMH